MKRGVTPKMTLSKFLLFLLTFNGNFNLKRANNAVNSGHYFYLAGLLLGKQKHSASANKK
jgi:hypothetical protein